MGLDLWTKEDIRNTLLGLELANGHLASRYSDDEVRAYREGFRAALIATAVSFGIYPGEIEVEAVEARLRMALLPLSRGR